MVEHWISTTYRSVYLTDNMLAHGLCATASFVINFLLVVTLAKYGALAVRKEYIVIFSLWVHCINNNISYIINKTRCILTSKCRAMADWLSAAAFVYSIFARIMIIVDYDETIVSFTQLINSINQSISERPRSHLSLGVHVRSWKMVVRVRSHIFHRHACSRARWPTHCHWMAIAILQMDMASTDDHLCRICYNSIYGCNCVCRTYFYYERIVDWCNFSYFFSWDFLQTKYQCVTTNALGEDRNDFMVQAYFAVRVGCASLSVFSFAFLPVLMYWRTRKVKSTVLIEDTTVLT